MADQPNGLFSLSDADLENLRRLSAQFGPSAEDQANAKKQAIMALGFGLLSGRKGNELATIGNAGQNALLQYQNDLSRFGQQRGQGLTQGMQVLGMAKQFQNTAMQDELTKKIMSAMGGVGQAQAPSGPPPVAPEFGASFAPPPGTPPAPIPQQQSAPQAPGGAPSWATPQLEALAAVSGRKDLADVIHRQMNLTQGPSGTLMRNGAVVGQVIPNYGMILDGKPQPLPKEVTDALVSYEGSTARAKGQAAAESELVTVPGPAPQSPSRMIPKAQYLAELKAQQNAPQEGAYGNRMQLVPGLSPDQQRIAAQDFARNAPAAQVPPSSIRTPAELPQIGQVPSPTTLHAATAGIDTSQGIQRAANEDFVKNSYRPTVDGIKIAKQGNVSLDILDRLPISERTGWGTTTKVTAARVLEGFGIAPDAAKQYAGDAQIFNQVLGKSVWDLLGQQKGMQTEGDAARAKAVYANLDNVEQANQFMKDMARATNNLAIKQGTFYADNYNAALKSGDVTKLETDWIQKAPSLWDDPAMKKWESYGKASGSAGTSFDYSKVPKGATYTAPDGSIRVKQ